MNPRATSGANRTGASTVSIFRPPSRLTVRSAAVRAKPIVLTGLAAMAGAFFILDDPIFSGLAVSLIFGLFVSTVLTLIVIPVVYYGVMHKRVDTLTAAE